MRNRTRIAVIAVVAMLGIGAAGLAWAWLSATSTATASGGQTGNIVGLSMGTKTYDYTPLAALYPGHTADVKIVVTNTNEVPVVITGITTGSVTGNCSGDVTLSAAQWKLYDNTATEVANNGYTAYQIPPAVAHTLVIIDGVSLAGTAGPGCANANDLATNWSVAVENR